MTWKVRGGTLTLEDGTVRVTRGGKVETVDVADLLSVETRFITGGCLGSCLASFLTLGLIWLVPGASGSWGVELKTRTGVLVSVPIGKKKAAILIQQAILAPPGGSSTAPA
jgi:hypothetical protein